MRARRLVIEDALRAEHIGDRGIGWCGEFSRPFAFGSHAVQVILLYGFRFFDLLELLWSRLGKLSFHRERDFDLGILAARNRKLAAECDFLVGCLGKAFAREF